jgi:hypothetical protein
MELLMNAEKRGLFWEQPSAMERSFILRCGEDILANLDFTSAFSSLGEAIFGSERWTLRREGFWSPKVSVRRSGSKSDLAFYEPKWTGTQGKIRFLTGEAYDWSVAGFWGTAYSISRGDGLEIITYHSGSKKNKFSNIFKQQAQMIIAPEAWQIKVLPILVLLGWYLVILYHEDSVAVAATASMSVLN